MPSAPNGASLSSSGLSSGLPAPPPRQHHRRKNPKPAIGSSVGVALPSASLPLPAPGDLSGQLNQASSLSSQVQTAIGTGDTSSLLGAGVTLLSDAASHLGGGVGEIAQVATDVLGGASAGFAVGGPYGAAAGAIVGLGEGIASALGGSGYDSTPILVDPLGDGNEGAITLLKNLQAWNATLIGSAAGHPQGWSMADYGAVLAFQHGTPRPKLLAACLQALSKPKGPDAVIAWLSAGLALSGSSLSRSDPAAEGPQNPLCTPMWWYWGDASQIAFCQRDEWFGWGAPSASADSYSPGPSGTVPVLGSSSSPGSAPEGSIVSQWMSEIVPPPGVTAAEVLQRAVAKMPDPLYWAPELYIMQLSDSTYVYNLETLVAMATIFGMRSVGASTRAINSELLLQSKELAEHGGVPTLFQSLLDDHLALGALEDAGLPFKGWGSIGSPLLGTGGVGLPPTSSAVAAATSAVAVDVAHYLGHAS